MDIASDDSVLSLWDAVVAFMNIPDEHNGLASFMCKQMYKRWMAFVEANKQSRVYTN